MVQASQALPKADSSNGIAMPQSASLYSITNSTVHLDGHTLVATVLHGTEKVPLKLELVFLANGIVRMRIQEEAPLLARFDETQKHVLRDEGAALEYVSPNDIEHSSESVDGTTVHTVRYKNKDSNFGVRIVENPWSLAYLHDRKPVIELNHNGFFHFEHLRPKPSADDESAKIDGGWEESFRSWKDTKPRGPESFGMDIRFNG
ncbi:glucosidase II, partial [Coemansia sp. RSA 2559]